MKLASTAVAALGSALMAQSACTSTTDAQGAPAVQEIAPGVTVVDGARVRVDVVDLTSLEETINRTASLAAVQRVIGRAEVVSPGAGGTMVHMYRLTDIATNAPKVLLVFVQGRDRIVEHLVSDRTP